MVRFSDIIRIDSKSLSTRAPADPGFEESKRRQGDPELRIAQQRGPSVDIRSLEKMTVEATAIYERLVKKASHIRERVLNSVVSSASIYHNGTGQIISNGNMYITCCKRRYHEKS